MGGVAGSRVVELGGVEGEAERGLDTGAESLGVAEDKDTGVVDLGLDKGSVVEVRLGADLEGDGLGGRLCVVDGLGTGLDVLGDLVVVRGREGREVAERVESHCVLWGRVADGTGVAGEGTGLDVVRGLGTDKEAVVANDGVSGKGGALDNVDGGAGVDRGLLVDGSKDGSLLVLGGVEGGVEIQLEALGNLVVELDLGAEQVGGGPCLGVRGSVDDEVWGELFLVTCYLPARALLGGEGRLGYHTTWLAPPRLVSAAPLQTVLRPPTLPPQVNSPG